MGVETFKNTLLLNLSADIVGRLQLHRVDLPLRAELEVPGEPIESLYFLEHGIASMTTCFENGMQVETSMFGYESVIGVSALMGTKQSLNRIFMQLEGRGYRSPLKFAVAEFKRGGLFQELTLRYVQAQLILSIQNAACNATHTYEQRLARWLLICADRAHSDTLRLDQEFVSEMLGSTRSTVSIAATHLRLKGLIEYKRGVIQILDQSGLEAESCECYRVVRDHLESFSDFDTGFAV